MKTATNIEGYATLAATHQGASLAGLVDIVLSQDSIFHFGALLAVPSIQEVRAPLF